MQQARIGTYGWSYQDWSGDFYPKGTAPGEYLTFYAKRYPIVEVDSSSTARLSRQPSTIFRLGAWSGEAVCRQRGVPRWLWLARFANTRFHVPF